MIRRSHRKAISTVLERGPMRIEVASDIELSAGEHGKTVWLYVRIRPHTVVVHRDDREDVRFNLEPALAGSLGADA